MSTRLITKYSDSKPVIIPPTLSRGELDEMPILDEVSLGDRSSSPNSKESDVDGGFIQKSLKSLHAYVPVEVTAAYIGAINFFTQETSIVVLWVALIMFLAAAPIYTYAKIRREEKDQDNPFPKWQCLMSLAFFSAWSYGIGGLWTDLGLHNNDVALLIMVGVTLLLPLIGQDENGNPTLNF